MIHEDELLKYMKKAYIQEGEGFHEIIKKYFLKQNTLL